MHSAVKMFDKWCLNMEAGTVAYKHKGGTYGATVPEDNAVMAPLERSNVHFDVVNASLIRAFKNLFPDAKS